MSGKAMNRVLSLIALALLVAVVACAAPAPIATTGHVCGPDCPTEPVADASTGRPSPSEMVPRITIGELRQKMESGANILIVDNRHQEEYDVDHIKGAVLAPLATIIAGEWTSPPDRELVLY